MLLSELGRVPTTEEVEQVFLHPRVRDQAVLGRPTAEGSSSHTSQLAIF